ncbi:DUF4270 family protein [Sunxiuqinia sp. sy24]|uniref:DUF4270 family protein n=1 Tax=Sunxiuqinia sp. sy24 TaxID=3461495 RepID=UPI0040464D0A
MNSLIPQKFSSYHMKKYIPFFMILNVFLLSCESENGEFEIGVDLVESKTEVSMVDSFTVQLSTVKYDSIPTSGNTTALVGYFNNEISGQIEASSYFNFDLNTGINNLDNDAIFDSLTIQVYYTDYMLGDSSLQQNLQVHRLTEELQMQEDDYSEEYLFNTNQFAYESEPLGELNYYPQKQHGYEEIRLTDELGLELIQLGRDEASEVLNNTNFSAYLKGFVLKADENSPKTIIGFATDSIRMVLYTHLDQQFEQEKSSELVFTMSSENTHFNSIQADRSNTLFSTLLNEREELPSTASDNKSFIQGSAGVVIRLDFPSLNELYKLEDRILLKTELYLYPAMETFNADLPEVLHFYETDKINQIKDLVTDNENATVQAILVLDELYPENSYYAADITTFLSEQLNGNFYDTNNGLLLTVPNADFQSQTDHLILEGENSSRKKPTLNFYFLTYE